jgi:hypothetical protein
MTTRRRTEAKRSGLGYTAPLAADLRAFASGWAVSGAFLLLMALAS